MKLWGNWMNDDTERVGMSLINQPKLYAMARKMYETSYARHLRFRDIISDFKRQLEDWYPYIPKEETELTNIDIDKVDWDEIAYEIVKECRTDNWIAQIREDIKRMSEENNSVSHHRGR